MGLNVLYYELGLNTFHYELMYLGIIITVVAQMVITFAYSRFSKEKNLRNVTGAEAARRILDKNNLKDVKVVEISGKLTDHYDPRTKVLRLSQKVYSDTSVASIAVAAHECGHAIQDKTGYFFLRLRGMIVPVVNFASKLGYFSILLGLLFSSPNCFWAGILAELVILAFQLITLPVEFNASRRALNELKTNDLISSSEVNDCRLVLIAAANTYVASVATSLLEILRLLLIFRSRDDR